MIDRNVLNSHYTNAKEIHYPRFCQLLLEPSIFFRHDVLSILYSQMFIFFKYHKNPCSRRNRKRRHKECVCVNLKTMNHRTTRCTRIDKRHKMIRTERRPPPNNRKPPRGADALTFFADTEKIISNFHYFSLKSSFCNNAQ